MSYITLNDIALMKIQIGAAAQDTRIIKDLIDDDVSSEAKNQMLDGVNYFKAEHTEILDRDFREYYIRSVKHTDYNAANNKIINAFHTLLVNQKNSYICGNSVVVNTKDDNEKLVNDVIDLLGGDDFDDFLCEWELNSSNKGVEWLHPYIDEDGEFQYTIIDAEQIIPIYDTKFQKKLVQVIRYYEVDYINQSGELDTRYHVEWWTENDITYYIQNEDDNFVLDPDRKNNPAPHFEEINTATQNKKQKSWGKVPFVPLPNNNYWTSDLNLIKSLVDDYDLNTSAFSNNLEDIQEAVWKLAGYEGADIAEARQNLKTFKIATVASDGDLEPIKNEIPKDARDSHLDRLEANIFKFGMGVDPNKLGDGNITNVVIKSRYALLDLKANTKIRKFTKALTDFMYFPLMYLGLDKVSNKDFSFTFNKNLIINTQEAIQNCVLSKGTISDETILENHPFVNNVNEEKKRLDEQRQSETIDLDNIQVED